MGDLVEMKLILLTCLKISDLQILLRINNCLFTIQIVHKQSEGLSMCNSLAPILSDIYMHYFEEKLLNLLNFKCWMRYVDDAFILIEKTFDINHVLKVAYAVYF